MGQKQNNNHYVRFYYTNQCLHNKVGINQLMMIEFLGYIYMNNTCEFQLKVFIRNIYNSLFGGVKCYYATQGLFIIHTNIIT